MIKNFDEIKTQLKDLSEIINSFKSEAVQLRIVELIFGLETTDEEPNENSVKPETKKKRRAPRSKSIRGDGSEEAKRGIKKSSGNGAVATLMNLVAENYFSKPRTIGDIVEHCEHNLARKFKANEFSGKLGRLVREKTLTRTKNSENQYEYQSK